MAVGFTTWTVCDNNPLETLESNLLHVTGKMPKGSARRAMVVARRSDGDLVIFNAVALKEEEMAQIEAFGRIAYMVVPNGFHRQDAFIWKQRYPDLKVVAPVGAAKDVAKAAPVDLTCEQIPADPDVWLGTPDGEKEKEALMVVRSPGGGSTVVTCDTLCNMPANLSFPISFFMGPVGQVSVPRAINWFFVGDKAKLASHLDRLAQEATRLIPGHGPLLEGEAARAGLQNAVSLLRG